MMKVIWYDAAKGNWDAGLLDWCFEQRPDLFEVYNTKEPPVCDRAIVIVVGKPEIEPLREYLDTLKSGLVILTSDEDNYFDFRSAVPPHLNIMTQYYNEEYRSDVKERILLGAPLRIKDYKTNTYLPKKYLWSFIGQRQNPHRDKCVEVLKTLPHGFLHVASSFGGIENGIEYQAYLNVMCQSKFALCPSGSMSADSFRVYEAIQCGAIPIVDVRSPRDAEGFDYWQAVFPDNTLIKVNEWNDTLMSTMLDFAEDYNPQRDNRWYEDYKLQLLLKLSNFAK